MKKHLLLYLSILILFSTGCQKDKDQFVPYPLDGQIDNMIAELLDEPLSFQVNAEMSQTIQIDKTFSINLNADSFAGIDEDVFTLDWINARNSIQMELHNLPHFSNNTYLAPSFTFNISSKEEVTINSNEPLNLFIESDLVEDQYLYYMSNEGWTELDMSKLISTEWSDENGLAKSGFRVSVEQFGWYTIASKVEIAGGAVSNFCIELEGQYTQANSKSMLLLDKDVVVPITRSLNQGLFCTTMNIPVDQTIRVISMSSLRDQEYEFYYFETQMENGLIVVPNLESKSIEEIKLILENI